MSVSDPAISASAELLERGSLLYNLRGLDAPDTRSWTCVSRAWTGQADTGRRRDRLVASETSKAVRASDPPSPFLGVPVYCFRGVYLSIQDGFDSCLPRDLRRADEPREEDRLSGR